MIISSGILYMARFRRTVHRPRSALLSKLLLPQRIPMCRNELACLYSEYNVLVYNLLRLAEASAIVPHSVIKIIFFQISLFWSKQRKRGENKKKNNHWPLQIQIINIYIHKRIMKPRFQLTFLSVRKIMSNKRQ